jgi:cytosine permease
MSSLPSYVAAAKPVPLANRAAWYKTIAPTYAGVMLWFVFWDNLVKTDPPTPGGVLSAGLGPAILGLVIAAFICHFLFYLVPGMLGERTGLPLYIVGTSTYGVQGGLFMPGLLMGLLQFGWLAVNAWAVSAILCECFELGLVPGKTGAMEAHVPGLYHGIIAATFAIVAAFVGLKGIKYVARVATYLPLIPVVVLAILLVKTCGGLGDFEAGKLVAPPTVEAAGAATSAIPVGLGAWMVLAVICEYVVGFFATAGAAGTDIASSGRDDTDVHWGGIGGVVLPTILAGGAALLIVAGAYGGGMVSEAIRGNLNPVKLMSDLLGADVAKIAMIGLAISSFPGACFSSLIAANSFKTTMPNVNPLVSVGIGALVAVILAVTGVVGSVISVFNVIGASFGPVCGAMLADSILSGGKWSGPRAGFNPAGWISWIIGFAAGAFNLVVSLLLKWDWAAEKMPCLADWQNYVPVPPVTAMLLGFVIYYVLALLGARTRTLEMPKSTAA